MDKQLSPKQLLCVGVLAMAGMMGFGVTVAKVANAVNSPAGTDDKQAAAVAAPQPIVYNGATGYLPQSIPQLGYHTVIPTAPAQPTAPAAGAAMETLSFPVLSVGRSRDGGAIYLNSTPNYRQPGNQSIRMTNAMGVPAEQFIGKQVTGSGPVYLSATGGKSVTVTGVQGLQVR